MIPLCLVFRGHEPWRLRGYNYFDIGRRHDYFDGEGAARRLAGAERLCYGPATELLARLLDRHPRFAFSLALSGPLREQLAIYAPRSLSAFRRLVDSGRVEPVSGTSHRSLPWPVSAAELSQQIRLGRDRVRRDLGAVPKVFGGEPASDARALALLLEKEGFAGLLLEGAVPEPERRRCHRAATPGRLPALVADEALSQDLALRFSDRRWKQWPLTAEKFDAWIASAPGDVLGLSLDLGTLGLAHSRQTGIFEFFEEWVERTLSRPESRFWTASEALAAAGEDAAEPPRRTVPAGPGNEMQRDALESLAGLERRVRAAGDPAIAEDFRRLTGADHFARMALPRALDPAAPDPEPAESPYEAYMAFRHAVSDLERRLPRARPDWSAIAGPPPA